MKPEVKAAWVAALRDPARKQGRGMLRNLDDGFCCLGVLCDISGLGKWVESPAGRFYVTNSDSQSTELPPSVMAWAGLDRGIPRVVAPTASGKSLISGLASLNDRFGYTFAQLADLIEAQL